MNSSFSPPRRLMVATIEKAGQAEEVAEVVPRSVIVDLVDADIALE